MKKIIIALLISLVLILGATAEETWVCSSCGEKTSGNFCSNCGQKKEEPVIENGELQLYIDVDFVANWVFDLYDVDLYVDDVYLTTIPHGKHFTELLPVKKGEHIMKFIKSHDKGVQGSENIIIKDNCTYSCTINAYGSYIDISSSSILSGIDGASLTMVDVSGYVLADAIQQLKETGFINIDSYVENSSVWDTNNWIVVSQNIAPDLSVDKNEHIVLTCCSKEEFLKKNFVGLTVSEAIKKGEEFQFKIIGRNYLTGDDIENLTDSTDQFENDLWIVKSVDDVYGERSVVLNYVYSGLVVVPSVVEYNLNEALRILRDNGFSNITYKTVDGSSVWIESNWAVLDQSISADKKVSATENIVLTCDSYSNLRAKENYGGTSIQHDISIEDEDLEESTHTERVKDGDNDNIGWDSIIPDSNMWGMSADKLKESYKNEYIACQVDGDEGWYVNNVKVDIHNMDVYYVFSNGGLSKIAYILSDIDELEESELDNCYQRILDSIQDIFGKPESGKTNSSIWKTEKLKIELGIGKLKKYTGTDKTTVGLIFKEGNTQKKANKLKPTKTPKPTKSATLGETNALASALSYLNYSAFSRRGLIEQLKFEGYSTSEAEYAVNNCGADWNEQAARSAKSYLEYSSFSRQSLIEQLEYEGFTHDQALYGVKKVGY